MRGRQPGKGNQTSGRPCGINDVLSLRIEGSGIADRRNCRSRFTRRTRQDRKGAPVSWTLDAEGVRDREEAGGTCQDIWSDPGESGFLFSGYLASSFLIKFPDCHAVAFLISYGSKFYMMNLLAFPKWEIK